MTTRDDSMPEDLCACGHRVHEGAHCRLCHETFPIFEDILNHLRLFHPDAWQEVEAAADELKDSIRKMRDWE